MATMLWKIICHCFNTQKQSCNQASSIKFVFPKILTAFDDYFADGRGNFTFLMDMYKTDQYKEPFNSYPVSVGLNQRLFLQVVVKSKVELVIFPDKCMATPTSEINDEQQYEFIEKGWVWVGFFSENCSEYFIIKIKFSKSLKVD